MSQRFESLRRPQAMALLLLATIWLSPGVAGAAEHRLGFGVHFWRTVDDFADDILDDPLDDLDDDGLAWVASYQYIPQSLLKFEIDLEYYDGGFAGSPDAALTPIGYVLIGRKLYGALGAGLTFSGGLEDDVSDPFFALRVGYQRALVPGIRIDINANYRAGAFNDLDEADTDAMTLGAILRFNL